MKNNFEILEETIKNFLIEDISKLIKETIDMSEKKKFSSIKTYKLIELNISSWKNSAKKYCELDKDLLKAIEKEKEEYYKRAKNEFLDLVIKFINTEIEEVYNKGKSALKSLISINEYMNEILITPFGRFNFEDKDVTKIITNEKKLIENIAKREILSKVQDIILKENGDFTQSVINYFESLKKMGIDFSYMQSIEEPTNEEIKLTLEKNSSN